MSDQLTPDKGVRQTYPILQGVYLGYPPHEKGADFNSPPFQLAQLLYKRTCIVVPNWDNLTAYPPIHGGCRVVRNLDDSTTFAICEKLPGY